MSEVKEMEYTYNPTNRERRLEQKRHSVIQGAMPPTGIHDLSRKARDKKMALAMKKARNGKGC